MSICLTTRLTITGGRQLVAAFIDRHDPQSPVAQLESELMGAVHVEATAAGRKAFIDFEHDPRELPDGWLSAQAGRWPALAITDGVGARRGRGGLQEQMAQGSPDRIGRPPGRQDRVVRSTPGA